MANVSLQAGPDAYQHNNSGERAQGAKQENLGGCTQRDANTHLPDHRLAGVHVQPILLTGGQSFSDTLIAIHASDCLEFHGLPAVELW